MNGKQFYVYILANERYGTLYVGVTSDLIRRVYEHKNNLIAGFTQEYNIHNSVYFEVFDDARNAIVREKRIKSWKRQWKIDLIQNGNPEWRDLYGDLIG